MLNDAEYLTVLRREGDAFSDSIARALSTPVASCEPWVGADLLWHMIEVHYSWKFIAQTHLMNPADYVPCSKPADDDLLSEYRTGLNDLIDVLSSLDPARSCWTWAGIQDVAWVTRRMAHETAVHAWDAHCAAGNIAEIDDVLASDGIDEFVHVMVKSNMREEEGPLSGSVHIHCTDVDGEWLIVPTGTTDVVVTREHSKGDCAIRGSASSLLLGLWRRIPMSSLEVIGSTDVAAQFLNRTANN
ncbi:MAG: hypothetical protein CK521_01515 [Acidimicrobium sp.]|nr:MAG: hypothetical protein CK521_01515 [Acidimicrobium sp.]